MAGIPYLRRAVDESIKAAGDALTDMDKATIAAARAYATQIDEVLHDAELDNEAKTKALHAIPHLTSPANVGLFGRFGVLSERELAARQEIALAKAKADAAKPAAPAKSKGSAALKSATRGGLKAVQ